MPEKESGEFETPAYRILNAQSFEELFDVLEKMDKQGGNIGGTQQNYSGPELIAIIQAVRDGKESLDTVTRTSELRNKVGELLAKEKQS